MGKRGKDYQRKRKNGRRQRTILEGFNLKRSREARTMAVKKCSVALIDKNSMEGSWRRDSSLLVLDVMGRKWLEWDEKSEKEGAGWQRKG